MRGYFCRTLLILCCISFFHLFIALEARPQESGLKMGGFQLGGALELGYRFTHVDGSTSRYKEVVNLEDGFRLFDLNFWAKDPDSRGIVDYINLSGSGIGDPYPSGRLEIKKSKTYDLVATYKEFKFFSDREDNGFLSDNHDFSQKRRRGTLTLSVYPKEDLQLNFGYIHSERDGDARVPRYPFILNLTQDLKEQLNEYFVSAAFRAGNWDFYIKQDFWSFSNKNEINEPSRFIEKRNERVNTYVSTLKAHTRLGERWDLDAAYIYAHSEGKAELTTLPVNIVNPGRGDVLADTHIAELGLSYLLRKDLVVHFDSRFHAVNQDGRANTDPDVTRTDFNSQAYTGTLQLEYSPIENLVLRGGYRFQYRQINAEDFVVNRFDGGKNPSDTTIWAHGWIASANWKPFKALSIYGEYQGAKFENPYTWISPESENLAKVKVKYDTPIPNLNLIGTFLWKRRVNPDQEYRVDIKDYVIAVTYQPSFIPRLSLDASFTYENIKDKKDIANEGLTPTPPFTSFTFDSDAYIYSGGISYEGIYKGLGARLGGNFARTRKENPQEYADGILSIWYKNKWVTPIVTLERTYLTDNVKPKDSFDANLITISLRKEF